MDGNRILKNTLNLVSQNFMRDIGHNDIRGIGTITVTFRFKQGQMVSFPDTTSNYKLYATDWSKILGTFEK